MSSYDGLLLIICFLFASILTLLTCEYVIPESVWSMALVYIIGIVIFILAGWLIVLGVITGQIKHLKKENILQLEESRKIKLRKATLP